MSDAWYADKMRPFNSSEDGCHPNEVSSLKDFLSGKTTPASAAHNITLPISYDSDPGGNLNRLWGLLIDALTDIPSSQPQIIQLLLAIQDLPPLDLKHKTTGHLLQNEVVWRDLPGFGHLWADFHKDPCWRKHRSDYRAEQWEGICTDFPRIAAIEAQLIVAHVGKIPLDWGYDCVCAALERSEALLDVEVLAAGEWLTRAGDVMHGQVSTDDSSWALRRERDLWEGRHEMSHERWELWKQRLTWVSRSEKLQAETRNAASAALEAMKAAEGGGSARGSGWAQIVAA